MVDSETLLAFDIPTYPDKSLLDKLSPERKFWTSRDCTLHVESQNPEKTIAYGTVEFDPVRDLGFSGDPNAIENLIWFLGKGKLFSTRSVLMQSLQGPVFARPQVNEKGIFSIPTRLFSLNEVPVKIPEELTLGR